MTKSELKNGMYVKLKDGTIEVVIGNKLMASDGSFNGLSHYDDNLVHDTNNRWDVVEVFVSSSPILFNENGFQNLWIRPNLNIRIGDVLNMYDDRYVVILRIDDDDTYPYVGLKFEEGDGDSVEFEPYSLAELNDFDYVRHIDGLEIIFEKIQGLVDGTI